MKFTLPLFAALIALAACGPSISPEKRAERAKNLALNEAAFAEAKTVTVGGKSFSVAHVKEREQALIKPDAAITAYTAPDLVAAAKAATGCNGKFDVGVLAFIGGDINTANLADIRKKISGRFEGWSVSLSC